MMMRRRSSASETANHPFRSMFDLMLALVFLLTAVIALGRKPGANYDARPLVQELLMLHNLERRNANEAAHSFLQDLRETGEADPCFAISIGGGFLTATQRDRLEAHRMKLWQQQDEAIQSMLRAESVTRVYGQDALQFPSGAAVPAQPERRSPILREALQKYQLGFHHIRVEGHTDNVRINTYQFPSNWELSAARAIWLAKEIENYFAGQGVPIGQGGLMIQAVGFGERKPMAPNDTDEHRRQNRRIEIVFEK